MSVVRRYLSLLVVLVRLQLRQILRSVKNRVLFVAGSLCVFGTLLLAWSTTAGKEKIYLSGKNFQKISLDVQCDIRNSPHTRTPNSAPNVECSPYYDKYDDGQPMTTSDVFFDILDGTSFSESESGAQSAMNFVSLLGNLMMNGLPFAGIDDYVFMSDFVTKHLGKNTLHELENSPLVGGKFNNFLNVRKSEIRLVPDNCWTRGFADYLQQTSSAVEYLPLRIFASMNEAIRHNNRAWVVLEIIPNTQEPLSCPDLPVGPFRFHQFHQNRNVSLSPPEVTVRMHPVSIPDTRNLLWSQRKQGGGSPTTLQSGQLLYFTSGFLTIQYEVQNFFSFCQLGGIPIYYQKEVANNNYTFDHAGISNQSKVGQASTDSAFIFLNDYVASAILKATSVKNLLDILVNVSSMEIPQPSMTVPLYDRAYPTRGYAKDKFWHNLGPIFSVAVIIYCSVPSALVAKSFSEDALHGQFHSLLTLPGVTPHVLGASSVLTCCSLSLLPFATVYIVFSSILKYSSALIVSSSLMLLSCSLGSVAVLISSTAKSVETAVILVPTTTFLLALPGMVYYDLAFDIQRTKLIECGLAFLPPSAAIIILRTLCTMESLSLPTLLTTRSLVSHVPLFVHMCILLIDCVLYFCLSLVSTGHQFQIRSERYISQEEARRGDYPLKVKGMWSCCHESAKKMWQYIFARNSRALIPNIGNDSEFELVELGNSEARARCANHKSVCKNASDFEDIALVLHDVSKRYLSTEKESHIEVLSRINAVLIAGCVTTLLGSNGGGKSTLLRILGGFDTDHSGNVYYVETRNNNRRIIGWCSQHNALYDNLTVKEHLELYCEILSIFDCPMSSLTASGQSLSDGISSLIYALDLYEHEVKIPGALSGGMKRRLSLALAGVGDPLILLLDEPTSGCDSHTREKVRQDILMRKEYSSVLISTHHIDDVEVISDRIWFLNEHYHNQHP